MKDLNSSKEIYQPTFVLEPITHFYFRKFKKEFSYCKDFLTI